MRRHFQGLDENLPDLQTTNFRLGRDAILSARKVRGICVLSGAVGLGKTFTAKAVRDELLSEQVACPWVTMPDTPSKKEVLSELWEHLLCGYSDRLTERQLRRDVITHLRDLTVDRDVVVFVDEAHTLRARGLQTLRTLHQKAADDDVTFTLVLIGSTLDLSLRDAPELDDRAGTGWAFKPLETGVLVSTLTRWHPVWAATAPSVLVQLDEEYCQGSMRRWASVLVQALRRCEETGRSYVTAEDVTTLASRALLRNTGRRG